MTTSSYGGPPSGQGQTPSPQGGIEEKKEQVQQVAGTAKDEGGRVASVAKDEAQHVAAEAKRQTANLVDQAVSELEQQSITQRDRLVDTLRGFTDDVERMLSGQGGGQGLAADLARQVADRARDVTNTLQDRRPGEILDDVRGFARRRPGTFLLGALAAGVVAGRLARGAKDSGAVGSSGASDSGGSVGLDAPRVSPMPPTGGTAAGTPTSGVEAPGTGTFPPSDPSTPLAPDYGAVAPEPGAPPPAGGPYGGSTL